MVVAPSPESKKFLSSNPSAGWSLFFCAVTESHISPYGHAFEGNRN